jgi:ABC-type transporter Mla MlaB component
VAAPEHVSVDRTTAEPGTLHLALGPLARDDLRALCDHLAALLEGHAGDVVVCDVASLPPDAISIDLLARLQLAARRVRCRVVLDRPPAELLSLLAFAGLADVLRRRGEPEHREEPVGVEERVERHDPPV